MLINTETKFCDKVNNIFSIFSKLAINFEISNSINIYKIEKKGVFLDYVGNKILYGLRLESSSSIPVKLPDLRKTVERFRFGKDTKLIYSIVKQKSYYSIYVHTFDLDIAEQIATEMSTETMSGLEVANSIFDLFLINEKEVKNNILQDVNADLPNKFRLDTMFKLFKTRIKNASRRLLSDYYVYQAVQYHEKPDMDIDEILKMPWEGVFQFVVDFNHAKANSFLHVLKSQSIYGDKETYATVKELTKNENKAALDYVSNNTIMVNSSLIVNDKKHVSRLASIMGINFDENYSTAHKIVPRTLILGRDASFNAITDYKNISKFFQTTIAKPIKYVENKKNRIPDFYARDLNGNFTNYALANNNNPHCAILGNTGTGKSATLLEMLSQIAGLDLEKNTAPYLENDEINIRYADVGYTGGRVARKLRDIAPDKSQILSSKVSGFKFALFDFDKDARGKVEKEDVKFIVYFINTMLSLSSKKNEDITLTAIEEETLIESITDICENNLYADLKLQEIDNMGGFDFLVSKALEKGYTLNSNISELSDEFKEFKIPILNDLTSYLKSKSNGKTISVNMKNIYSSLESKLISLNSFDSFSGYSNVDFTNFKNLYYIDFNDIKEDQKAFTAIFWLLFKKWYSIDKKRAMPLLDKGEMPTPSYYIIEEAHNFFKIPSFADLFKVAAKEARKFHVYLIFLTQEPDDIPKPIFNSLATKIVLALPKEKAVVKKQLAEKLDNMTDEESAAFDKIEKYSFCVMHNEGFTTMRFDLSRESVALYKPYSGEE